MPRLGIEGYIKELLEGVDTTEVLLESEVCAVVLVAEDVGDINIDGVPTADVGLTSGID